MAVRLVMPVLQPRALRRLQLLQRGGAARQEDIDGHAKQNRDEPLDEEQPGPPGLARDKTARPTAGQLAAVDSLAVASACTCTPPSVDALHGT